MTNVFFSGDDLACKTAYTLVPEMPALMQLAASVQAADVHIQFAPSADSSLHVTKSGNNIHVHYAELIHVGRGLSLAAQHMTKADFSIQETPCFSKCGVMLDVSRNAVLTLDAVKFHLRKMALMGLNLAMLYTEDTYEVDGEPYIGYMRGRYTSKELTELDDYAYSLGIELIPCIQTLGHLDRVLQWPALASYADTPTVLLAESEETYELLAKMIRSASQPFRTNRIHIGMDETWGLGTGKYRNIHGDKPGHEIMLNHLAKLGEILDSLGLHAMMWSDMYFRLASPTLDYYDLNVQVPDNVRKSAPANVDLVYWDYYNEDPLFYREYLNRHLAFPSDTIFAGGIWTWAGPAPHYQKSIDTTIPALTECKAAGIEEVFLTAWGDAGSECSKLSLLLGMQMYAEFNYAGEWNNDIIKERFTVCVGEDADAFLQLTGFHSFPGVKSPPNEPANPGRTLLYQDPLIPLMEKDYENLDIVTPYKELQEYYADVKAHSAPFEQLFQYYHAMAAFMHLKNKWHTLAPIAVRTKNRQSAQELCSLVDEIQDALALYITLSRALWMSQNRPHGYEILDIRLGGLSARFCSAQLRMQQFANGEIDTIEELETEKLPFLKGENGEIRTSYAWPPLVSPGRI